MEIFEEDPSFGLGVVSSMIIGSFDCGWGLPTLIRVPLLALKHMDVCLFHFPFCFGGVFKAASTVAASLANISGDFHSCYSISMLPIEASVSTVSTYTVTISASVFAFCFGVTTVVMPAFTWDVSAFSALFCSLFSLGVCVVSPCSILGSAIWPFPSFYFCPTCACFVLCFFTTSFLSCFSMFPFFTVG